MKRLFNITVLFMAGTFFRPAAAENKGLDTAHRTISDSVSKLGQNIDSFFGDERIEEEIGGSHLRLRTEATFEEKGELSFEYKVQLKLSLPNLENHWQLFLESFSDEDDTLQPLENRFIPDDDTFTGLRYFLSGKNDIRFSADVGAKWDDGPEGFIRLRGRKIFDLDPVAIRLTQDVFWFNEEGFLGRSRFDIEKRFQRNYFLRSASRVTWSEDSEGVEWRQNFSLFRYDTESEHQAIGLSGTAEGHTWPSAIVDRYILQLKYRRLIYKDWLYLETIPAAQFPNYRDFNFTPEMRFQLEMNFGRKK